MPLREGVLASWSVGQSFREQDAGIEGGENNLVRVAVVALDRSGEDDSRSKSKLGSTWSWLSGKKKSTSVCARA
jgi:hypothetical protein